MSAICWATILGVPRQARYYGLNHLHFITASTYRRARLLDSDPFRRCFVATLGALRSELELRIAGYVLMPEHFHVLIWPSGQADPSRIVQGLKQRTARFVLRNLRENPDERWRRRMLARLTLPPTVHDEAHYRVWQRRFYDLNVWSSNKRDEKLSYMHNNPLKRGLAREPGGWEWSSWRCYYLNDASLHETDRLP